MLNGGGCLKTKERHAILLIFQDANVKIRFLFNDVQGKLLRDTGADGNTGKGRREERYISAALLRQHDTRADENTRKREG